MYHYVIILNLEHTDQVNAVLDDGPGEMVSDLWPQGVPGDPDTWPTILEVINTLGAEGFRFHSRNVAEPHWVEPPGTPTEDDPAVWGIFMEHYSPAPETF